MKFFGRFMVYLLISIGAAITLLPFAWMVATSFKLPSEVNKWPPQWGSKNFLGKREIKVVVGARSLGINWEGIGIREALSMVSIGKVKENVLVIAVNDDPFYRGELHILVTSDGRYAKNVPISVVEPLLGEYSDIPFLEGRSFKSADDFFDQVFLEYSKILKRVKVSDEFSEISKKALGVMRTLERFAPKRIRDENQRGEFLNFLTESMKVLDSTRSSVERFRRGKTENLSDDEIEEILSEVRKLRESLKPPDFTDKGARMLLRLYEAKVLKALDPFVEKLEFYVKVKDVFERVQKERLDAREIVAKFRKKSKRYEIAKERILSDETLRPYRSLLERLMADSMENIPERFVTLLDNEMADEIEKLGLEADEAFSIVSEMRQMVSSLMAVSAERGVDVLEIAESVRGFEEMFEKLGERMGDLASLRVLRGKARRISQTVGEDPMPFIREAMEEAVAISELRRIYSDSLSELDLISAPSIVETVRVREGKSIEVVLKGVPSVYLEDEDYRVAVFFSPSEVLANVFQNYVDAWHSAPFGRYYINTVFVATTTTILEVILASMAAFAFSILQFPGRDFVFGLFLMTMMVPGEVLLVPNFITITKFGWIDTYYALIVPWIVSVFAIFLIRQHFLTLPRELYDAAKIDGCSNWRYLWTIAVPLSKPVIITGALLKFVGSWNAFLWVLIVTNSEKYRTLPVGLHTFSSEAGTVYNQLMAAATFSILPVIVLFLFMQKYFIRGIARTGLK